MSDQPTRAQLSVLRGIQYGNPFTFARGRSQHGGYARSLTSVIRRGWAAYDPTPPGGRFVLTDIGRALVGEVASGDKP